MALESLDGKHGIFTGALLRGLLGEADSDNDRRVTISELADFVETQVSEETRKLFGYEQFPMRDLHGQNFPVSRKR